MKPPRVVAIIPAAGYGKRLCAGKKKPFKFDRYLVRRGRHYANIAAGTEDRNAFAKPSVAENGIVIEKAYVGSIGCFEDKISGFQVSGVLVKTFYLKIFPAAAEVLQEIFSLLFAAVIYDQDFVRIIRMRDQASEALRGDVGPVPDNYSDRAWFIH